MDTEYPAGYDYLQFPISSYHCPVYLHKVLSSLSRKYF
jgi:hypothetical protein